MILISLDRKTTKTRKQKWDKKQLHRYFMQQSTKIALIKTWT